MTPDGGEQRKLGHEVRLTEDDPSRLVHTSMYLDRQEFDVLAKLPADLLVKTGYRATMHDDDLLIDVFQGPLAGLS